MIDLDALLVPTNDAPPCGEDLTYDAEFLALENAASGKPEQQFGETVIPAEPPDWREVEKRSIALLSRTKDIRVVAKLSHALTNTQGVRGMSQGVQLMAAMFSQHWDHLHPLPEDGDHFMRMNAVASLNDVTGQLRDLRQQDFLRSAAGAINVRDAESLARGTAADGTIKMSLDQLRGAVFDAWRQGNETLGAWVVASESFDSMQAIFRDRLDADQRPDLEQIRGVFSVLCDLIPKDADALAPPLEETQNTVPTDPSPATAVTQGFALRTRSDAVARLMEIAEFLERTEPTNPAPLLIRRAVRLMGLDFLDILRELSPDSVAQVENITGVKSPL
ncbi:type VI secretion system protein TssA [Acidovorax sp. NCPPB 3576]|uniref:type VI secretion system protein TssA n=1 Tax=Acidovorax sp. NCPPB 3576 TaxID=2940488 RepID=UPI00234B04AD|nr:type VI secretion system protein TssA [Acidovorax sp. NCPPB 3576]WCM90132.1 type VI secretion system protein TssA [Acidovorax sp. NCPPB 3576]